MEGCLLCLELKQECVGSIFINSEECHDIKIRNVLNKYLWSMNHITDYSWMCTTCWTELHEFHKFYIRIEKVHRDLGLINVNVKDSQQPVPNKVDTVANESAETPTNEIVEAPFEVLVESTADDLNCFLNEVDVADIYLKNDDTTKAEGKPLKIEANEDSLTDKNILIQKRKRGRPRKDICNDTDVIKSIKKCNSIKSALNETKKLNKGKCIAVCKVGVESINSSYETKTRRQIKSKESPAKDIVVNKENTTRQEDNKESELATSLTPASQESLLSPNNYIIPYNESDGESSDQSEIKASNVNISPSQIIRNKKDKFIADNFKMTCFLCDIPMATFYCLRKHFKEQHTEAGYIQCCNRKFYRRSLLFDHVHYHLDPNYFKCNKCDKVMEDRRRLDLHIKTHEINNGKNHYCDVCGKGFLIVGVLNRHKLIHLSEEEKKFKCTDCSKKFATNYMLNTHHRINHLKKYVKICDTCGKSIRDKDVFRRHMLRHEGKTVSVSCDVCGLLLTDSKALKRHKEVIHPEGGQKLYTCSICSKTSPNLRAHKLHVQFKHEMGYNYKCTICDKAFKKAPSLKEHMASHTGTILYTCPWCPKTFNSNANMHHHRKRVHPKEWEETSRKRYSGKLPPYFKPPTTTEPADLTVSLDS